ncbi:hypothetical protein [Actinomadura sp. SCN-SB]|uniref:GAP1-N2 domain-containing protein n=1 Tax=Actinomadura sp. SCN-SB TaxID=3373092 RepID=UPI0037502DB9
MAWQLHYTSTRRGPTGRAGFQFVAETPGLPEGARAGVTPYLSYRPPPGAPLSPEAHELDRFPVALLYDRVAGRPLLLRCRYLGRDYSGRYGNFFAHAVVAEEEELEGLRPAELWHAPLWNDGPLEGNGAALPLLEEFAPGAESDPEFLAEWLAGQGKDPYGLLAGLMDAVTEVLRDGHGRVVLVADDVEPIARWIAVVSYSLPVAAAAGMSFVTYSADPDAAAQRLVGTTPDVWASSQRQAGHAFHLDEGGPGGHAPSRHARTVAACWRAFDFAGLDALAELGELGEPGEAATLLSLCRGDRTVTAAEEAAVVRLVERYGERIPGWVWRELAGSGAPMGLDLALAVHARVDDGTSLAAALESAPDLTAVARIAEAGADPSGIRAAAARCVREGGAGDLPSALARVSGPSRGPLLEGVLSGLAEADPGVRRATLTGPACDALYAERGPLLAVPVVALPVLVTVASRHPGRRVAVTADLLALPTDSAADEPARALARIWTEPPSAAGCLALMDAHPGAFGPGAALAGLPSRTFGRIAAGGHAALCAPETQRLVARVRTVRPDPGGESARAAVAVGAYTDAVTAERPERAAEALAALTGSGAADELVEDVLSTAARRLAASREPPFRAALLAAVPGGVRSRLGALWAAGLPGRARSGRSPVRTAELAQRNGLIEVVLRLRLLGVSEPALETWARSAAGRRLSARMLDAHFSGDPRLRTALKELIAEARGRGE